MVNAIETVWDATRENDWRKAATAAGAALQQDWSYGAANAALGGRVARAASYRGGAPRALAQFLVRDFGVAGMRALTFATAFRGPLWLAPMGADEKAAIIRDMIRSRPWGRRSMLLFMPEAETASEWTSGAGLRRVMTGQSMAHLDLSAEPEALRAAMRQKWRNRLVRTERVGAVQVVRAGVKQGRYLWLLSEEESQQRRKRYRGLPPAFTAAYAQASGKDGISVFRADIDGARAAAMLFLRHGAAATYHIGWSNEAGRKAGAHNLVLWRAMLSLRRAGVRFLDLGGVNTESGAGVARFKLGAGGRVATLPGAYL